VCAAIEPPRHVLLFVALAPWLAALDRTRSARGAAASALVFSVAFALAVFPWFAGAMASYTGAPRAAGFAALVLLAPVLQPQILVYALVRHAAGPAGAWGSAAAIRALVAALAYVGAEWALPKLFADTLGHGLHSSPWLRQGADLAGAPGLSVALLLANEAVLRASYAAARSGAAPRARARGALLRAGAAAAIAAALAGYGAWRLAEVRAAGARTLATAALVQADISGYRDLRERLGSYDAVQSILGAHFTLTGEALARGGVDLAIWPETVYPTTFGAPKSEAGAELDQEITDFVDATAVPLVFGAYDAEAGAEYNAAFFLRPSANGDAPSAAAYRKAALFPLTERVPAWMDSPAVREWLPWMGTWRAGAGPRVVPFARADGTPLRVAPLICYDALEPRFVREAVAAGAELILALSNDAWFAEGQGPNLHLVVSAFRSIETRRPQLRATNTGISAVIDAGGEIVARLGVHERGALVARLPAGPDGGPTLAVRWGEWLGPAAAALSALGLVATRARG
jgi:apolipoprotein N-acyltransferase